MPSDQPSASPKETKVLYANGGSDVRRLAAAIANITERTDGPVAVEYIGAGAGNQAIKAVAVANSLLAPKGKRLVMYPVFAPRVHPKDNAQVTAMQLRLSIVDL